MNIIKCWVFFLCANCVFFVFTGKQFNVKNQTKGYGKIYCDVVSREYLKLVVKNFY